MNLIKQFFAGKVYLQLFLFSIICVDVAQSESIEPVESSDDSPVILFAQAEKASNSKPRAKKDVQQENTDPVGIGQSSKEKKDKKSVEKSEDSAASLISPDYVSAELSEDYTGVYYPSLGRTQKKVASLLLGTSSTNSTIDYTDYLEVQQKLSSAYANASFAMEMGSVVAGLSLLQAQSKHDIVLTGASGGTASKSSSVGALVGLGFRPSKFIDIETDVISVAMTEKSNDKETEVATTTKSAINSVRFSVGFHSAKYELALRYTPKPSFKEKSTNSDGSTPDESNSTVKSSDIGVIGRYLIAKQLFVGAKYESADEKGDEQKGTNRLLSLEFGLPFESYQLGMNIEREKSATNYEDSESDYEYKADTLALSGLFKLSKAAFTGFGFRATKATYTFGTTAEGTASERAIDLLLDFVF